MQLMPKFGRVDQVTSKNAKKGEKTQSVKFGTVETSRNLPFRKYSCRRHRISSDTPNERSHTSSCLIHSSNDLTADFEQSLH